MRLNQILIGFLTACCILSLNSGCQKQNEISKAPETSPDIAKEITADISTDTNTPPPQIVFENTVCDLGKIGPGDKSSGEFKFKNSGKGVLKISKVSQCCGVVTKLEKMEYAPGESGVLKFEYSDSGKIGPIERRPVVHSNDPSNPSVTLFIKAETVRKVSWKPARLRLFPEMENAACPKLTIQCLDNQPFSIIGFQSTGSCITVDYDPTVKATEFVLDLKVDMEKITQNTSGSINIILTHPQGNLAEIPFSVLPKFTVSPKSLVLQNVEQQKPIKHTIKILNNYNAEFEIESTSSQNNTIKVIKTNKVNNGYHLNIEIIPPVTDNKTMFSDVFYINIKGGEQLAISCIGNYVK